MPNDRPLIRASELVQFSYCAKAWYLARVQGVQPSNQPSLEAGAEMHSRHGGQVALAGCLARLALACLLLGGLLAVVWLALRLA